jgi:predicted aldo/keto reductase-like oxidoreductase
MGVFIISPNDKGGKLYDPPAKLVDLCPPLTPMQFNALYCLARPQVHTLS